MSQEALTKLLWSPGPFLLALLSLVSWGLEQGNKGREQWQAARVCRGVSLALSFLGESFL